LRDSRGRSAAAPWFGSVSFARSFSLSAWPLLRRRLASRASPLHLLKGRRKRLCPKITCTLLESEQHARSWGPPPLFLLAAFCAAVRTLQEFLRDHVWDHRRMRGETLRHRMPMPAPDPPGARRSHRAPLLSRLCRTNRVIAALLQRIVISSLIWN